MLAQVKLDDANIGWLWACMLMKRQLYPPEAQHHVFAKGFSAESTSVRVRP
ncbi:LasR-specific antiactivator QslA [Pseudomonas sediminis]|uniref:LasR-specific antiactivator QslA n=1 Tax=Pseudomonas sediminis TaxID=1691904 RepID=UPI003D7178D4